MAVDFDALKALLTKHEGLMLKPYVDTVGKVTIGIGHNLTDKGISLIVATHIYHEDITEVINDLTRHIPWIVNLTPARQIVLFDMGFNLGVPGLLKFINTLGYVKAGQYDKAANAMLHSKWATQVGHRAVELAHIMQTGILS
jgi:lysozyme